MHSEKRYIKKIVHSIASIEYEIKEIKKKIEMISTTLNNRFEAEVDITDTDLGFPIASVEELESLEQKLQTTENYKALVKLHYNYFSALCY